jgi:hypothetical protein
MVRPPRLTAAAEAWLAGSIQATLDQLGDVEFGSARATSVGLLLRAAARWTLWRESGESDDAMREAATADIVACRQADDAVAPFADAFPPGFVRFFEATAP